MIAMPVTTDVSDDDAEDLGSVDYVVGEASDTARVKSWYWWSILPGVRYFGTRIRIEAWVDPLKNEWIRKTGTATGTTGGTVVEFANVLSPWHEHLMVNQGIANYALDYGDSGAPVFMPWGTDWVNLGGVHWGGMLDEEGELDLAVFSLISQVLGELSVEPMTGW